MELSEVIAETYLKLVGDKDDVTALGCLLTKDASTATLTVQTGAEEVKASLRRGAEHFVEDEGAVLEVRWNPRSHPFTDAQALPTALAAEGLSGEDAVAAILAALEYLYTEGTLDEIAHRAVQAVLVVDDAHDVAARDRVALLNNRVAVDEWAEAFERFSWELKDH